MSSAWDKFETGLKNQGLSFESVILDYRTKDKVCSLMMSCGINDLMEVTEILDEWEKRLGKQLNSFIVCESS